MAIFKDMGTDALKGYIQNLITEHQHQNELRHLADEAYHRHQDALNSSNIDKGQIEEFIQYEASEKVSLLLIDKNADETVFTVLLCHKFHATTSTECHCITNLVKEWISLYEGFYWALLPPEAQYANAAIGRSIDASTKYLADKIDTLGDMLKQRTDALGPLRIGELQTFAENPPQINIQTFTCHTIDPDCPEHLIDLSKYFDGAALRDGFTWNGTVFPALQQRTSILKSGCKYTVVIDASFSIAFAFGRLFPGKSRVGINIKQSLRGGTVHTWSQDNSDNSSLDMNIETFVENEDSSDVVIMLSITRDIDAAVKEYLQQNHISPNTYIACKPIDGPSFTSVRDGGHADKIAEALLIAIDKVLPTNRSRKIHLFCACPNAVMFFFGRISQALGSVQLYEYNMDLKEYHPTISF